MLERRLAELEDVLEVLVDVVAIAKDGKKASDDERSQRAARQIQGRCGAGNTLAVRGKETPQDQEHQVIQVHRDLDLFLLGEKHQRPDQPQDHEGQQRAYAPRGQPQWLTRDACSNQGRTGRDCWTTHDEALQGLSERRA